MKFLPILIGLISLGIAVADTPRILDDPEAFIKNHPKLSSQRQWTEFATPEQIALFTGPETDWPVIPPSDYDLQGFNQARLYSKVPPPGIHPRILFSPEDVPLIKKQLESTKAGQQLLIETDYFLAHTIYDPQTDEGKIFAKLASGDLSGLEWPEGEGDTHNDNYFKGFKPQGTLSPHWGYMPRILQAAAFRCILDDDKERGPKIATAIANYWKLREPIIDRVNASENEATGHPDDYWRGMHQAVSASDLGFNYDLAAPWMTEAQKKLMRRVIAKATSGKLGYGANGPRRWRDTNWVGWDLTHFLASLAIEGEKGYDLEIQKVASETVRDYLTWGIDPSGVIFEPNGKNGAGLLFALSSAEALARRGENFLGHPHLRKLTSAQVQDVVPQGGINVNNGTWACKTFWGDIASMLKAFYPRDACADWLLRQDRLAQQEFDADAYRKQLSTKGPSHDRPLPKMNLLAPTDVLTKLDWEGLRNSDGSLKQSWVRDDLHLPDIFNDPIHGLLAARSGNDRDALFMMFEARPDLRHIGHQHHDSGHFYLAALGEMWGVESGQKSSYSADYNTVLIDGKGHSDVSAAPRVRYLGAETNGPLALASADLKNAYDCGWTTPMHISWQDPAFSSWKLSVETDPEVVAHFKGTEHYKMRLWGDDCTKQNWGPTMRIVGNPVEYAFRTAGIIRGPHPYALVMDDINKDGVSHLYEWLMQIPTGTRMLPVIPGKENPPVSVIFTRSPAPAGWDSSSPLDKLPKGEPGLLVCLLQKDETKSTMGVANVVGSENYPIRIEQHASAPVPGGCPLKTRMIISKQAVDPRFRVLMIPVRGGEPLPYVSYDEKKSEAMITWAGQRDLIRFSTGADQRSRMILERF